MEDPYPDQKYIVMDPVLDPDLNPLTNSHPDSTTKHYVLFTKSKNVTDNVRKFCKDAILYLLSLCEIIFCKK